MVEVGGTNAQIIDFTQLQKHMQEANGIDPTRQCHKDAFTFGEQLLSLDELEDFELERVENFFAPPRRKNGASEGIRTPDLRITSAPLCRLSYAGSHDPPLVHYTSTRSIDQGESDEHVTSTRA